MRDVIHHVSIGDVVWYLVVCVFVAARGTDGHWRRNGHFTHTGIFPNTVWYRKKWSFWTFFAISVLLTPIAGIFAVIFGPSEEVKKQSRLLKKKTAG